MPCLKLPHYQGCNTNMQSRQRLKKLKKKTGAEAASIGISGGSAGMHGSACDPEGLLMSYWIGEQTVCSVTESLWPVVWVYCR